MHYLDRYNEQIILGRGFIRYRNRSIPYTEIKEIRVKGNRFLINHYRNNTTHPTVIIFMQDKQKAEFLHDELLDKMFYH